MYALNLDENNRCLSSTFDEFAPPEQPRVETLPDGNLYEYRYIDGEFIHDPLPAEPEPTPEPTTEDILNALLGTGVE